jgi:predicted nucleotidyltransferase
MFDIFVTSRTRRKLLAFFAFNHGAQFYLHQLAREIGESAQSVRSEMVVLAKSGLVFCTGAGRQKRYQLNGNYPYLEEIRSIINKLKNTGYSEFNFTNFARKSLLEQNLKDVTATLITKYKPEKIILFGSLASGKVGDTTDIDLLVVKNTNKPYYDRIREVTSLCDYNVGIDFLVYNLEEFQQMAEAKPFVKNEILKKGKVLYVKTT